MSNTTPARLLTQYYRAVDNDRSHNVDSKQVVQDLARIAVAIGTERGGLVPMKEVTRVRQLVGLCNSGGDHWLSGCLDLHAHTETESA